MDEILNAHLCALARTAYRRYYLQMAIYHMNSGFVTRSTGRSSVQAAAYLTGEKLYETRRDLVADYTNRGGDVVFKMTLAPDGAPSWMSTTEVWDKLESFEDTFANSYFKNPQAKEKHITTAQMATTFVLALPKELSMDGSRELVERFLTERFVSRALIGTAVIHDKEDGNPHAHLLVSRRAYDPETGSFSLKKDREIVTKYEFIQTRKLWADMVNESLIREGIDQRIDHRSFVDQGLDLIPSQHEGWYAQKMEGFVSRIIKDNKDIVEVNREKILLNPEVVLKELSLRQATFTKTDLSRLIQKRMKDDSELGKSVYEACSREILEVGIGVNGETRYTTNIYKEQEEVALKKSEELFGSDALSKINSQRLHDNLRDSYGFFNAEQRQAVETLCGGSQLSVLVGRAGSGKTTMLKPVVEAYREAGYEVIGMSLATMAAENLELETGCPSESMAFYLDKWDRLQDERKKYWSLHPTSEHRLIEWKISYLKKYELSKKHVVILDEAGMVGTKDWAKVLDKVCESGAKLLAVGDDHQFKAIEAGDFFRKLKDRAQESGSYASLDTIIRQKEPWMREASHKLAELRPYEALADYEQQGFIKGFKRTEAIEKLAEAYVDHKNAHPKESSLLLTYTRDDCALLNEAVRERLKVEGWIQAQGQTIRGKEYCIGDKIAFFKNDREKKIEAFDSKTGKTQAFLVKNGSAGKIIGLEVIGGDSKDFLITAAIDEKTHIRFKASDYKDFSHGYALTLCKSQGQTVDRNFILASRYMDAHSTYVALTRHRKETSLYYGQEDFADFRSLQRYLGRAQDKDLIIDYHRDTRSPEQARVHEYVVLGQDLNTLAREKEWETFRSLQLTRKTLGREILDKWENHKDDVRQAGLTRESLEISCGLKARPLSRAETNAYKLALVYQSKADEARALWREIRQTHPGSACYKHEKYEAYTDIRWERDKHAYELLSKPSLLSLAYKAAQDDLRVSKKTLEIQAARYKEWETLKDKPSVHESVSPSRQERVSTTNARHTMMTPEEVKQTLQARTADLAKELLGNPSTQGVTQWRYGNKGSIAVFVAGTKQGLYSNFESGVSGGCLKMIEEQLGLDHKGAYKWALDWLGHRERLAIQKPVRIKETTQGDQKAWTPVMPVPANVRGPNIQERPLSYQLEGRHETMRFAYKDKDGSLLGYVVRLEDGKGDKVTLPLTYCVNSNGKEGWRWQGFGDNRPLYGLDHLAKNPDKPVLIVEGEKAAEAGRKMLPDHVIITWQGGASAVKKADWSPLEGRSVTLWPDHDEPGLKAAQKIEEVLKSLPIQPKDITIVDLPHDLPKKWDLADALPKTWTEETVKSLIRDSKDKASVIPAEKESADKQSEKPEPEVFQQDPERTKLIYKTIHTYGLERAFGETHKDLHNDVEKLHRKFEAAYNTLGITVDSEELTERCTFMAMQLQMLADPKSPIKADSNTWRQMSVSSSLWMDVRDDYGPDIAYKLLAGTSERIQTHVEEGKGNPALKLVHSVVEMTGRTDLENLKWDNAPLYQQALRELNQATKEISNQQREYQSQTTMIIDKTIKDYSLIRAFGSPSRNIHEKVDKLYKGFEEAHKALNVPVDKVNLIERCTFMAMQLQKLDDKNLPPKDQDILRRITLSSTLWMDRRDQMSPGFEREVMFDAIKIAEKTDAVAPKEISAIAEITNAKDPSKINWDNMPAFEQAHQKLEQTASELFKQTLIDKTIKSYRLGFVFGEPQENVYSDVDKLYKGFAEVYKELGVTVDSKHLTERCTFMAMQLQKLTDPKSPIKGDQDILRRLSISSTFWVDRKDSHNSRVEYDALFKSVEIVQEHNNLIAQDSRLKDLIPMKEITGIDTLSNIKQQNILGFERAHQKLDEAAKHIFKQHRDYQNQTEAIINRTIENYGLNRTFGKPQHDIHKDVDKLYKGFEEVYGSLGIQVNAQELTERCTFMAMQLQKLAQPHFSKDAGEQDLARRMSVSSFLWVEGRENRSLSFERDVLYKSASIVKEHNKMCEQDPKSRDITSIRELTDVRDLSKVDWRNLDSYTKASQKLEQTAHKLLDQQKLEHQRIQRQQEQQRLMERSKGFGLER